MKTKKSAPVILLLGITILAYMVASVVFCYTTKPAVSEGEFPFSITYEYKGETNTLSGVLKCEYAGSDTVHREHQRYWNEEVLYDNPDNVESPFIIDQNEELQTTLCVYENMNPGYFMGDPLYGDYYTALGLAGVGPRISYYDYKNGISLEETNQEEVLESFGFRVIDFTYAEPIENSFSFSGIRYEADNVIIFMGITLVFFIGCMVFVRRDKTRPCSVGDKLGIVLNVLVAVVVIPFISFFCILFGIVESSKEWVNQTIYNIPPFMILCLALSVVFRRKGYGKAGLLIQFVGLLPCIFAFVIG